MRALSVRDHATWQIVHVEDYCAIKMQNFSGSGSHGVGCRLVATHSASLIEDFCFAP